MTIDDDAKGGKANGKGFEGSGTNSGARAREPEISRGKSREENSHAFR